MERRLNGGERARDDAGRSKDRPDRSGPLERQERKLPDGRRLLLYRWRDEGGGRRT